MTFSFFSIIVSIILLININNQFINHKLINKTNNLLLLVYLISFGLYFLLSLNSINSIWLLNIKKIIEFIISIQLIVNILVLIQTLKNSINKKV